MRVGAAQMELTLDLEANLRRIERFTREAQSLGVRALVFPEMALTGYHFSVVGPERREVVEEALEQLGGVARQSGVTLMVGTPWWEQENLYNSVAVLPPEGNRRIVPKRHLVADEEGLFTPGQAAPTFELGAWRAGVIVCRDQNYPDVAAGIKREGGQLLFQASAHYYLPMEARWKVDKNVALPVARATENQLWVIKANCVGSVQGKVSLGHSLIAGPNGVVVTRAGEREEALVHFELDAQSGNWSW